MTIRHNDYSTEMPHLSFVYDEDYYPSEADLPDPQIDPVLVGARVPIQKAGVGPIELPMMLKRRDGTTQEIYAKASLYGSLDNPHAKGLNFSRFYITIHEALEHNNMSIEALKEILMSMKSKQGCLDAFCKLKFNYRWTQDALRSRDVIDKDDDTSVVWKVIDGIKLSHVKKWGHIFYECELDGRIDKDDNFQFFLTVNYRYSSTCPCSFTLAQTAMQGRNKAANGHSQRSNAKITIEIDPDKFVWIEDVVELARTQIPTEVVIYCKRVDEGAFSELNGANLLFTEDASRLLYEGLDVWFEQGKIKDFSVVTSHSESLHPYEAIAVMYKGIPNGLR